MISYFLILMAIALLVGGIIFVARGWSGAAVDEVVPMEDLAMYKELTTAYPYEQKLQQSSIKIKEKKELVQEEEKPTIKNDSQKISDLEKQLCALEETAAKKAAADQEAITQLAYENNKLKRQTEEKEAVQKTNNQKLNEANETINLLQAQKVESARVAQEVLGKQENLEKDLLKIKDFNNFLLEKEKILQYELTKQRAQTMGLEKVCEDFKIQIDDLTKTSVISK